MIEVVPRPAAAADLDELARLLVDAVESGASVSFMSPLSVSEARQWWRTTLEQANREPSYLSRVMNAASPAACRCILRGRRISHIAPTSQNCSCIGAPVGRASAARGWRRSRTAGEPQGSRC